MTKTTFNCFLHYWHNIEDLITQIKRTGVTILEAKIEQLTANGSKHISLVLEGSNEQLSLLTLLVIELNYKQIKAKMTML